MTLEQKNCTIQMLLDLVEVSCKHERLTAARALLYIGQGSNSYFVILQKNLFNRHGQTIALQRILVAPTMSVFKINHLAIWA